MKIALIQLKTDEEFQIEEQFKHAIKLLESLEECDLVVLPELWLQGAFGDWSDMLGSVGRSNYYLNLLKKWAREKETWICVGSFLVEDNNGRISNKTYFIDSNGNEIANYSKRHLFGHGSSEANRLQPGTTRSETKVSFGTVGFAICYDLRFPEHFRASSEIPEIFVIPSAWPNSRIYQFISLAIGRAIENQCYIIACNGVGSQGKINLGGNSVVIDFEGVPQLQLSDQEEIGYCTLNLIALREFRDKFDVLKDRITT